MDVRLHSALRWLLVLAAICASSFVAFILGMGLILWPDRSIVATLSAFGIAPRAIVEATHQLDFFLTILIWLVPPICAIGFAARTRQRRALRLGLSISILLFATLCFFLGRQDRSVLVESVAILAAIVALSALTLSFLKSSFSRLVIIADFLAILLLFSPSLIASSRRTETLPQAKQLWSTTLQPEQWWERSQNTGSEYAATRQLAFAGDRVVVVFDAGFAPSQPPKDKWPVSMYRLVSLDAKTGAKRNEITFSGRWARCLTSTADQLA